MKPNATTAMSQLIEQIRTSLPFDSNEVQLCKGPCKGCSMKLLQFMENELDDWQARLDAGENIGLAELSKLGKTGQRVYQVLEKNGHIKPD